MRTTLALTEIMMALREAKLAASNPGERLGIGLATAHILDAAHVTDLGERYRYVSLVREGDPE